VMASITEGSEGDASALAAVVDAAADALIRSREEEGTRLVTYLHERLSLIDEALNRLTARAPQRLVEQRDRLRESVRQLMDGVGVEEQRIAQEIAVLADRLDIQEELARFRSHLTAFRRTLSSSADEAVGKRLGFLLQEMLREANTMGSKANDGVMLGDVVTIKEEIERIREQVENLE